MALSESRVLRVLSEELGTAFSVSARGRFRLPIGDDCAVFKPPSGLMIWTNDACVEGRHFRSSWVTPEQVAQKSFHAALSDISAMGGRPFAALSHLGLGEDTKLPWLRRFAREQARLGKVTGCPVVGGNVTASGAFEVVTSVLGSIPKGPLTRNGAAVDDELWLVGELGLARAGLLILEQGLRAPAGQKKCFEECLEAFRRPVACLSEGPKMLGRATAMMDVSDGLRRDLASLAMMSEARLVVDEASLSACLSPHLLVAARALKVPALSLALDGGEDYALIATGPAHRRPNFARRIGVVKHGPVGAFLHRSDGEIELRGGFEHRQ